MVLVDTSVWIQHFKKSDLKLVELLDQSIVVTHSFVLGELYLGRPLNKPLVFQLLDKIPLLPIITYPEIRTFIDEFKLVGKGLGFVDLCLLASAYSCEAKLYTYDKKLASVSQRILRQ